MCLVVFGLFVGNSCLTAQAGFQGLTAPISFEQLTTRDGLAANKVICVTQDQQGFIWIGTQEALHRYDGYELLSFTHDPDDETSLSNSTAEVIYVDRSGAIWVGTWNGLNRYDPLENKFTRYLNVPEGGSENIIHAISEDQEGRLWIGTSKNGLNRYDPIADRFIRYDHDSENKQSLSSAVGFKIYLDRKGTLWVGTGDPWDDYTNWGGLNRYNPKTDAFVRYEHDPTNPSSLGNNEISTLFEDEEGNFWVATWGGGLQLMDRELGTFTDPTKADWPATAPEWPTLRLALGKEATITCFREDHLGVLWTGAFQGGLDRFDPEAGTFDHYEYDAAKPTSLSGNIVWSLFEDQQNILWVSTWNGLNKVLPRTTSFQVIGQKTSQAAGLVDTHVEEVLLDKQGNIWAGTWAGLERIDAVSGTYKLFRINNHSTTGTPSEMILSLHLDQADNFWVGSHHYGLLHFHPSTGQLRPHRKVDARKMRFYLASITEGPSGEIWVTGTEGVNKVVAGRDGFEALHDLSGDFPQQVSGNVLSQSKDGNIWLGADQGLYKISPAGTKVTAVLEGYNISTVLDDGSIVWLGTNGGQLLAFDPGTREVTSFSKENGLPGNTICALIKDEKNRLWVSTDHGLAWLTEGAKELQTFPEYQLPPIQTFYPHAVTTANDGDLLFGGDGGILRFDPTTVYVDSFAPVPVITGLMIFNNDADTLISRQVNDSGELEASIHLSFRQNDLTFKYAGLHFVRPEANEFRYLLENYEEDWRYVGDQRTAIYPNLPPGEYVFRVQSANPEGTWSQQSATMNIIIRPPWWKTPIALALFIGLLVGAILFIRIKEREKLLKSERAKASVTEARLRAEVAEDKMQQLRELDESKARLYANITHEFRTPLTVILGMVDNIRGHQQERNLIERNSQNLLRLINQLLDLSKLDADAMSITLAQGDIILYLQYLTESFYSMAQEKEIRLLFYPETPSVNMDFDEQVVQQVIYNLLSNALKFTDKGGKILLHATEEKRGEQSFLKLKVTDTGIGIPPEDLSRIFDRFYQTDSSSTRTRGGTGIGLALTKKLVELMGGTIEVESSVGKGTLFTLFLPIQNEAAVQHKAFQAVSTSVSPPAPSSKLKSFAGLDPEGEKPLLLLIEDNADVVFYIVDLLAPTYEVVTAANGQSGIEKALEVVPDIIISDVMMPGKDGYEVCLILKQDERSSHIPIVLLTAKATHEDRLKGLKVGADAYLVKPFHKEELFVWLDNLVVLRKTLQGTYSGTSSLTETLRTKQDPTLEDQFLKKLITVVTDRIDDPDLGVVHLCHAARLSNTQVNRKLKALTGRTPSQFIRFIRLERAAELLKTTENNISEVAYSVGFNDPNYFTRVFSDEFGFPPGGIRK